VTVEVEVDINDEHRDDNHYLFASTKNTNSPHANTIAGRIISGNLQFWTVDESGNVDALSYTMTNVSNGIHVFGFIYKNGTKKIYVDGLKVAEVTTTNVPNDFSDRLYIGTWGNGTLHFNSYVSNLHISRIARPDTEIGNFVVDEHTTAYWDFENNLITQVPSTINNGGTAESKPKFTAYIKKDSTLFSVVESNKFVLIGQPDHVEKTSVQEKIVLIDDSFESLTGWSTASSVDGGAVAGSFASNGKSLIVTDYGAGTNWHGPSIIQSLSTPIIDYDIYIYFTLFPSYEDRVGRVELYLGDDLGANFGKVALKDAARTAFQGFSEWRLGNLSSGIYPMSQKVNAYKKFDGYIKLSRRQVGSAFHFFTQFGEFDDRLQPAYRENKRFVDKAGKYGNKLGSVQIHAATHGDSKPVDNLEIKRITVARRNAVQSGTEVPIILRKGDKLEIDNAKGNVLLNGLPALQHLNFNSQFFKLKPGANPLAIHPSDIGVVEASWPEAFL
jgi:hypothetical protein